METNKQIIERAYASFAQGDVPAALAAFADEIHWVEPDGHPLGGTYVGHEEVVEGVSMRLGEIGDEFAVVPDQFVADGDTVVALGHLSWMHKGSRAPATPAGAVAVTIGPRHEQPMTDRAAAGLRSRRR